MKNRDDDDDNDNNDSDNGNDDDKNEEMENQSESGHISVASAIGFDEEMGDVPELPDRRPNRAVDEQSDSSTGTMDNGVKKRCQGWSGPKYNALCQEALKEHAETLVMSNATEHFLTFPLASRYAAYKGFEQLRFVKEGNGYVLRSSDCQHEFCHGSTCRKYCGA